MNKINNNSSPGSINTMNQTGSNKINYQSGFEGGDKEGTVWWKSGWFWGLVTTLVAIIGIITSVLL